MGEAGHKPSPDGIADPGHDDRNCRRCLLGRVRRRGAGGHDNVHGQARQLRRGCGEPVRPFFRRSIFNGDVTAFDVAKIAQSSPKLVPDGCLPPTYDADARDFRAVLRARRERPRRRTAERGYQISPSDVDWHVPLSVRGLPGEKNTTPRASGS